MLLSVIPVLLAIVSAQSAVTVGPKRLAVKILGVGVTIATTVAIEFASEADAVHVKLDANGDLADVQAKALTIAKGLDLPKDNCAHDDVNVVVDDLDQASLTPNGDTAVIALSGHVTVWECRSLFGGKAKLKVLSDSVTISAPVRLAVLSPTEVGAKLATDPSVTTGAKVSAVAASVFVGDLRGKLAAAISKMFETSTIKAQLPDLPGLVGAIEKIEFVQDGSRLGIHAIGSATGTGATLSTLVDRLLPLPPP